MYAEYYHCSGLLPRVICELLTVWLANILTQIINEHLIPKRTETKVIWKQLVSTVKEDLLIKILATLWQM